MGRRANCLAAGWLRRSRAWSAMAEISKAALTDVSFVLNSLRHSLALETLSRQRSKRDIAEFRAPYIAIEDARYQFSAELSSSDSLSAILTLESSMRAFLASQDLVGIASEARFRPVASIRPGRWHLSPEFARANMTVAQAVLQFADSLRELPSQLPLVDEDGVTLFETAKRLRALLPAQQVSPARFAVVNKKIVVVPQPAEPAAEDKAIAASARRELVSAGERLMEQLRQSNCDQRLVENISELQRQLTADSDIVQLGIANIGCMAMCDRFESELPDAISAMLKAQTTGIGMYVSQFPDWIRFSENAASTEIDDNITEIIRTAANEVVGHIERNPQIAQTEVPRIIKYVSSFISDPKTTTKRSVFAVFRTLENIIIAVYAFSADVFEETIRKSKSPIATAASKALVTAVLGVALAGATRLLPASIQLQGTGWMRAASEIVERHLHEFKGD
jgi:hypothetical protein